jgi:hypothetical protein
VLPGAGSPGKSTAVTSPLAAEYRHTPALVPNTVDAGSSVNPKAASPLSLRPLGERTPPRPKVVLVPGAGKPERTIWVFTPWRLMKIPSPAGAPATSRSETKVTVPLPFKPCGSKSPSWSPPPGAGSPSFARERKL